MFYNWNWSSSSQNGREFNRGREREPKKTKKNLYNFFTVLLAIYSELEHVTRVSALGSAALVTHRLGKDLRGAIHQRGHTATWGWISAPLAHSSIIQGGVGVGGGQRASPSRLQEVGKAKRCHGNIRMAGRFLFNDFRSLKDAFLIILFQLCASKEMSAMWQSSSECTGCLLPHQFITGPMAGKLSSLGRTVHTPSKRAASRPKRLTATDTKPPNPSA